MKKLMTSSLAILLCAYLTGCGVDYSPNSPAQKSPPTYEITGRYLDAAGDPVAGQKVYVKQSDLPPLDEFIETTVIYGIIGITVGVMWLSALPLLLPFILITSILHDCVGMTAKDASDHLDNESAGHATTDENGVFKIKVKSSRLTKSDGSPTRNVVIINQSDNTKFAKAALTLEQANTDVGDLILCDMGLSIEKKPGEVNVRWTKPTTPISKINFFAVQKGETQPFWIFATEDVSALALKMPQSVFPNGDVRIFAEGYYQRDAKQIRSCIGAVETSIEASPSLTENATLIGPNQERIKAESITDEDYSDEVSYRENKAKVLTIDVTQADIHGFAFHNLSLAEPDANVTVKWLGPDDTWQTVGHYPVKRFFQVDMSAPISAKQWRFEFSDEIQELSELTVY